MSMASSSAWSPDGSTSPFRSSSLPCSPFRKSANASASLRIAGTRPIRQQQAGRFLQAACTTANFLEKSSILNDLASLDIASDVEGLESAKQNLQIVQKRLMVREAFVYESFASRRLKEILKVPLPAGPRWAWMLQGIETAEDTLPKLKEAGLASLAKKVNALLKRAIDHLQSGIMQCLEEALQLEDLELLNELRPWISRGRLAQRSDAVPLLLQIGQFVAAYNALSDAMEKGTGDAFRMALWRSEEAGLQPERCEMLRRAEAQYGPIRRQKEALWAALAARISGNIGLLEAVLPMANAAGINTIGLEDALETRTKSCQDMLEKIAKLTRAARREDIQQLQAAILSLDPDAKTSRRYSLDKLQEEVRDQANQTLFDAKQKAKVQKEISLASKKRSTQVLQEMPKAMMKAEKLRMSTDLRQASSTLKRAQIEKEIRTAISLSDAHTLRAAVAKAESSSIEGLQDVIDQGRAALHEMTLLDNTRELVKGASTVEQLETGLDELIQENFPNGLQPQSSLRQVQAHILAMKQKLSELQQIMASPISFENNNTLLQESGMKQMRLVLDILRVHQYFAITIEHGLAHLAGERAKAVHDLLSKGCRNPLSKKQINEKNKQVKLACQMEKATPELKAALLKMLIKVQSSETNDLQARKSIKPKSQELKKSVSFHSSLEESSV